MSNKNCLKFTCKYRNHPDYRCSMGRGSCLVQSLGSSVTIEDKENLRFVLTYDAVKDLTADGSAKLFALLECNGFDVDKDITKFDHVEDKQVEYLQQREWQD